MGLHEESPNPAPTRVLAGVCAVRYLRVAVIAPVAIAGALVVIDAAELAWIWLAPAASGRTRLGRAPRSGVAGVLGPRARHVAAAVLWDPGILAARSGTLSTALRTARASPTAATEQLPAQRLRPDVLVLASIETRYRLSSSETRTARSRAWRGRTYRAIEEA